MLKQGSSRAALNTVYEINITGHFDFAPFGLIRLRLECGILPGAVNLPLFPLFPVPCVDFGPGIVRLNRFRVILSEPFLVGARSRSFYTS